MVRGRVAGWAVVGALAAACDGDDVRRLPCFDEVDGSGDDDGDGLCNAVDACPSVAFEVDADGDCVSNAADNCEDTPGGTRVGPDGCAVEGDSGDTSDSGETDDTSDSGETDDTSDSGETDDTSDSGETDDTGDSGDTDDTGDSGDTDDTDPGNRPPVIQGVAILPVGVKVNSDLVTCTHDPATDPDGNLAGVTYQWRNVTQLADLGTAQTLQLAYPSARAGDQIRCTVTAEDVLGSTASAVGLATLGNRAPVVTNVAVTSEGGEGPFNTSTLTCTAQAQDPDGGGTVSMGWENVDRSTDLGSGPSLTLDTTTASPGEEIRCVVEMVDEEPLSGTGSASVILANRDPWISSVSVGSVYNDDTDLTCAVVANDWDGDSLVIDVVWRDPSDALLSPTAHLDVESLGRMPGDKLVCDVAIQDPHGGSTSHRGTVTVLNRLPQVSEITAVEPARVGGRLVLDHYTVVEPDGQDWVESAVWWDTLGPLRNLGSGTSVVLPSAWPPAGETVRVSVTVDDGLVSYGDTTTLQLQPTSPGDVDLSPTLGRFRFVPAGAFSMGCVAGRDEGDEGCEADELPSRSVSIGHGFWIQEGELGKGSWPSDAGSNPTQQPSCTTADCPQDTVSWWDALAIANHHSALDGLAACYVLDGCSGDLGVDWTCTGVTVDAPDGDPQQCEGYRLPTEAEWAHAARAGEEHTHPGSNTPNAVAHHVGTVAVRTHAACGRAPNAWGLCDMAGNVSEWVWDRYGSDLDGPLVDPVGPGVGTSRVARAGSYLSEPEDVRTVYRVGAPPDQRRLDWGFRLVRSVLPSEDNAPPSRPVATVSGTYEVGGLSCGLAGGAIDPDGDATWARLAWRRDGMLTPYAVSGAPPLTATVPFGVAEAPETWTCEAWASDGMGSVQATVGGQRGDDSALGPSRYVPPGVFSMGCLIGRDATFDCASSEEPDHAVTLPHGLWVAESETTQAQWTAAGLSNPSSHGGADHPIEEVSWYEAVLFGDEVSAMDGLDACFTGSACSGALGQGTVCAAISALDGDPTTCEGWRLPTEAEWEHAARAAFSSAFPGSDNPGEVAWYSANNTPPSTKAVCGKDPNHWGLCDMAGNVREWVWDGYGPYPDGATTNPLGAASPTSWVVRNGGNDGGETVVHTAFRSPTSPDLQSDNLGFRLVRTDRAETP